MNQNKPGFSDLITIPPEHLHRLWVNLILAMLLLLSGCRNTAPTFSHPSTVVPVHTLTPQTIPSQTPLLISTVVPVTPTPLPWVEPPVVWVVYGQPQPDLPLVNRKLNEVLAARGINIKVEIWMVEPFRFEGELRRMWEAGEPLDLVSTGSKGYLPYETAVKEGRLLALTSYVNPQTGQTENLLESHQALWESLPPAAWEAVRSQDQIYAVPNQHAWVEPPGVAVRADVIKALDLRGALEAVQSFEDLTPIFEVIHQAIANGSLGDHPAVQSGDRLQAVFAQANLLKPEIANFDRLGSFFVMRFDDPQGSVYSWLQTPEFRQLAALRRSWQEAGFGNDAPLAPDLARAGYEEGHYSVEVARPVAMGSGGRAERYGFQWIEKPLAQPFLTTGAVTSAMTGISSSIHGDPERVHRVMKLLELLHTDAEIYNLVARGIEGMHWRWAGSEKSSIILVEGSAYRPGIDEQFGDQTLAYGIGEGMLGAGEATRDWNRKVAASVALGFVFDPRPVAAPYARSNAAAMESIGPLLNGQEEQVDFAVDALVLEMQAAGLDIVESELRSQFEAWRSAR